MEVKILNEAGYDEALYGISLSFNAPIDNMPSVAGKLSKRSLHGGENKYLESMAVWIEIDAPRYWWQQFDTYRIGVTKQSESTMHTILKSPITSDMFEGDINKSFIDQLEEFRKAKDFKAIKDHLPESFNQRRIIFTNYKTLRHIIKQRKNHRLSQWQLFCREIVSQLAHPEFIQEWEESDEQRAIKKLD